ncbi:hypothetical protein PV726_49010 [Streptomyces europaeiscabiei]|nr:VOC family protein [Streptomyces europaeiscabiei]MDX3697959.1 hypothetical protein [Streptomyces europaeiscabiei]
MVSVLQNVAIDCADAYELARFWSRVTGRPLHPEDKPHDPEVQVLLAEGPVLHFNQVPDRNAVRRARRRPAGLVEWRMRRPRRPMPPAPRSAASA